MVVIKGQKDYCFMLNKVIAYISKMNMIQKNDKVIVGISGGADSVCLLFVLLELQKQIPFTLTGVHVNHGIRAEAVEDESYVRALCETYQIPCYFYKEDVRKIAAERRLSEEEAGRIVRREAFEKTMSETGSNKIALAHHQNDNAETLLWNLARGTGLLGLCGISPVSGSYIRPLLCVSREEIEEFLKAEQIAYCVDKTNLSDDYTRNRIRNHIVPYLEQQVNPAAVSHINETIRQLRMTQEYLEEQMYIYRETCVKKEESGYIVKRDEFELVPEIIRPMLIKDVLASLAGQAKDIEAIHLHVVQELLYKQVGKRLDLPYGISAKRTYEGIWLKKDESILEILERYELVPEIGKTKKISFGEMQIAYTLIEKADQDCKVEENSSTQTFDYDIISESLVIRTRESGDTIYLGTGGTQKLKSFYVNQKVTQEQRDRIPLLAMGDRILWIYGYRTDMRYRVTEHTKTILKIQIEKGE